MPFTQIVSIHDIYRNRGYVTETAGIVSRYGEKFEAAEAQGQGVTEGGTSVVAGRLEVGSRGRRPEPYEPLAPTPLRQGGRKACHFSERANDHAGAKTARAGAVPALLARAPAKPALAWERWAGSVVPAWRVELEAVGFCGVVVALLSHNAQGRAELVLRVEDKGDVVLVLGSARRQRVADLAQAQAWAEGVALVQLEALNARAAGAKSGKVSHGAPQAAQDADLAAQRQGAQADGRRPAAPAAGRGGRGPVTLSSYRNKKAYSGNSADFVDTEQGACEGLIHGDRDGGCEESPQTGLQAQLDGQTAPSHQGQGVRGDPARSAASIGGRSTQGQTQGRGPAAMAGGRAAPQGGQDSTDATGGTNRDPTAAGVSRRSEQAVSVRVRGKSQKLPRRTSVLKGDLTADFYSVAGPKPTIYDIYCM